MDKVVAIKRDCCDAVTFRQVKKSLINSGAWLQKEILTELNF